MTELKKAAMSELDRVCDFYRHVCADTPDLPFTVRWIYGKHPDRDMIRAYIDADALYYFEDDGHIVAAAALAPRQEEEYRGLNWRIDCADDEVAVLHLLCAEPARKGQGLAKALTNALIDEARRQNKKAVRLDAMYCNIPAQRLYEKLGFERRGMTGFITLNVGLTDFVLYELGI